MTFLPGFRVSKRLQATSSMRLSRVRLLLQTNTHRLCAMSQMKCSCLHMISSNEQGQVFVEDVDNLGYYFAKKELKRQVYDRMSANDLTIKLMIKYEIHPSAKDRIDNELRKASTELPNKPGLPWRSEKKGKVQDKFREGNNNATRDGQVGLFRQALGQFALELCTQSRIPMVERVGG